MIKKYYPREGAPFKKEDAQKIGEFIDKIENKTTENILNEIEKNEDHVIHNYIEWNDDKAANGFRLQQVRNIISHVEVKIIGGGIKEPVRAFHSIINENEKDEKKFTYVSVDVAFSDNYAKMQIISRAKTELKNWRDRYHIYNELKDIVNAIEPFIDGK